MFIILLLCVSNLLMVTRTCYLQTTPFVIDFLVWDVLTVTQVNLTVNLVELIVYFIFGRFAGDSDARFAFM